MGSSGNSVVDVLTTGQTWQGLGISGGEIPRERFSTVGVVMVSVKEAVEIISPYQTRGRGHMGMGPNHNAHA